MSVRARQREVDNPPVVEVRDDEKKAFLQGKEMTSNTSGMFGFMQDWDYKALLYLTTIAFIVRLAFLHHPSVVIFDEVHFGGFAQKYLTGQFFLDLHPPLARLLVTLSAWVGGFDGKFTFYNIGADYLKPGVPYMVMRAFTASLGALMVPIAFVTLRGVGLRKETSAAMSMMLVFENASATQFRYILLDAYLCFFTALTAMFWVLFKRLAPNAFSREWKLALVGLGASMALAASCKWVGLFLVAGVGIWTVTELWAFLGDTKMPLKAIGRHFIARAIALIVLPLGIYTMTFYYHFQLQRNTNPGAVSMSIEYQQTLNGGTLPPTARDVFYGSIVRLRQYKSTGPFLHSHPHTYPEGSKQQQVTGYHHRDQNNLWVVRRPFVVNATYVANEQDDLVPLKAGDEIRLQHVATTRYLHSHPVAAPVSHKDHHFEVSAYGSASQGYTDLNDNWKVVVVDSNGNPVEGNTDNIWAIGTKFRLTHSLQHCSLQTAGKSLPEWGYKQNEITCSRDALRTNMIWVVESNEHPLLPEDAPTIAYPKLSFFGRLLELNRRMWQTNAGLAADHPFGSRPMSWPLLSRGIGFWNGGQVPDIERIHNLKESAKANGGKLPPQAGGNGQVVQVDEEGNVVENPNAAPDGQIVMTEEDQLEQQALAQAVAKFKGAQVYLLGNPLLWWACSAAVGMFFVTLFAFRLASRRSPKIANVISSTMWGSNLKLDRYGGFFFLQWVFHFFPFFGMRRQLFLHHYLPALHFAFLLLGLLLETILDVTVGFAQRNLNLSQERAQKVRNATLFILTAAVIVVFIRFAPLGYGFAMTKSQCNRLKWLPRWDFDCNGLPDTAGAAIITTSDELVV